MGASASVKDHVQGREPNVAASQDLVFDFALGVKEGKAGELALLGPAAQARIAGTGRDGGPACATVGPLGTG